MYQARRLNNQHFWTQVLPRAPSSPVHSGWRELCVRLCSIGAVSRRCNALEANASHLLEVVLPKLQAAQMTLLGEHSAAFLSPTPPP
jgi:hypothetical protein